MSHTSYAKALGGQALPCGLLSPTPLELPDDVPVPRTFRMVYTADHQPIEAQILIKGGRHLDELVYQQELPVI